ncbi:MAG: hypothetical protein M0Z75_04380 [Nitrospiraceae bacterium]|nr:hypothetical protein [Nitrospiraceae bacterium]
MTPSAQDKIWKVVRGLKPGWTLKELLSVAEVSEKAARPYFNLLKNAGYLRKVGKRKQWGRTQQTWALAKNTGAQAPRQTRCLYDPNTDKIMEVKAGCCGKNS